MCSEGESVSRQIDETIHELSECREDVRNNDNQLFQVAAVAATALGLIFGISVLQGDFSNTRVDSAMAFGLFALSAFLFCAVFSYVCTLGATSVLRFHYIQYLEDKLTTLVRKQEESSLDVHWTSFSSSVATKNPAHLNSKYSKFSYFNYVAAILFIILFCGGVAVLQYQNLEHIPVPHKMIVISAIILFLGLSSLCFFYFTTNSKKMFAFSLNESKRKKELRLSAFSGTAAGATQNDAPTGSSASTAKNASGLFKAILYFIYPKTGDIQKLFLVVLGFLMGVFLHNGVLTSPLVFERLHSLGLTLLVFDVLIYQARYQWNDIRGLAGDIASGRSNRLPASYMGARLAITVSTITIFLKIGVALFLIYIKGNDIVPHLFLCSFFVILFAILYETFRSKGVNLGVFLAVSLGYPLRILVGLLTAWPNMWMESSPLLASIRCTRFVIVFLLVAYALLGEFSAVLPWIHDVVRLASSGKELGKSHYHTLRNKIEVRYSIFISSGRKPELSPLKANGECCDFWNYCFIISILCLSFTHLTQYLVSSCNVFGGIIEFCILLSCLALCRKPNKSPITALLVISLLAFIAKFAFNVFLITNSFAIMVLLNQVLFTGTYFFLRYLFNPNYKINFAKLFLGDETYNISE